MDIRSYNPINIFKSKEDVFRVYFILIYTLVITIPFNHKEAFSVYDPDLVWSKYVLVSLSFVGLYFFFRNLWEYVKDPFFLFLLSFVGFQVLSLFQTGDFNSSIRMILFQTAITFSYIPIRNFIYERKNGLGDLVNLYALIFIPVFVFLMVQIYLQSTFQIAIGGVWPVGGYPTRYGATFWDINHFGAFCSALSLILIGHSFKKGISLTNRVFTIAVSLLSLIALYLTSSRSSLLGFGIGSLVFLILLFKNAKFKVPTKSQFGIYYFSVVAIVLGFLYLIYQLADSLRASLLYRSVSFFSHLFLLKVGIIVGLQNFFLGIGTNSFHAYFKNTEWANIYYYIDRAAIDLKLPLHNLWLEVLAETGLISFSVFVGFWILILIGLYRAYIAEKNYLLLGFIGALISFLVAGLMYSYKSEFFWLFVLVAAAYVSKVYFREENSLNVASIKKIICPNNCDIKRVLVVILSLLILFLPLVFITHPLSKSEIFQFGGAFESSFLTDRYTQLLVLFKYIIGNYTYTGRMLSVILYLGTASLLFLIAKRYLGGFNALAITATILGVTNILEPNLIVSIKFFFVFIILVIAGLFVFIASILNRNSVVFDIGRKFSKFIIIAVLLVLGVGGVVSSNIYFKNANSTELTFLLELAYNRRLMDKSLIQVSSDIELDSIYYFSDEVHRNERGFFTVEGDVMPLTKVDLAYYTKNLFIYTDNQKNEIEQLIGALKGNPLLEVIELSHGDYNLLLLEKKTAPLVQLQ